MMVLKNEGGGIPTEVGYTKEEVEAYETALALSASDMHFRFKMKRLAERCLVPQVGRALGNDFHIRVDDLGNPEILYQRVPIIRFTLHGLRLSKENVGYGDRTMENLFNQVISLYTDYRFTGYGQGELSPRDITDRAIKAGFEKHSSYYAAATRDGKPDCKCSVCQNHAEFYQKIFELNKRHDEFVESQKIIFNHKSEDEKEKYPFVPYKDGVEVTLPDMLSRAYDNMKTKRGWNRRDK